MSKKTESINQVVLASQLDDVKISADIIKSEDFSKQYQSLENLINYLKSIKETVDAELKNIVEQEFLETGESSIKTDDYSFTYVSPTTKESLDTKRLKAEDPELYKKYVKVSNVSGSLRVTKRKKKLEKPEIEEKKNDDSIEAEFSDIK